MVDADGKRSAALQWSMGVTYEVLAVIYGNREPVPSDRVTETWWRLFPLSSRGRGGIWLKLVNLYDGWFARTFKPLSHADVMQAIGIDRTVVYAGDFRATASDTRKPLDAALRRDGRRTGRSATFQLGMLLGWPSPVPGWPPPRLDPTTPMESRPVPSYDKEALVRFISAFRRVGERYPDREKDDAYHAAQAWESRRSRNKKSIQTLESRINAAGVSIEWSDQPNTEPLFRPNSGNGSAVRIINVVYYPPEPSV